MLIDHKRDRVEVRIIACLEATFIILNSRTSPPYFFVLWDLGSGGRRLANNRQPNPHRPSSVNKAELSKEAPDLHRTSVLSTE